MNSTLSVFCLSILFGFISAYLAHRRGKNPYFWFLIGFVFGIFGVMAFFLGSFYQNRAKVDAEIPPPLPQPYIEGPADRFWYYLDTTRQQQGPMSFDALTQAWKKGDVSTASFVWHEELTEWKPLQELIKYK